MKNHIVIDARLYGPQHTGIGRYTKNLLLHLPPKFKYTLLVYPELYHEIRQTLGNRFSYVVTKIRHYSLLEQLLLPPLLYSLKPDLVHFTHFSKPILYFGRSVVTVHDLIRHFSRGSQTTTRSPILYWPKYFGYQIQSYFVLHRDHIIVPSNYWRNYIIDHYHLDPHKIVTTYEAVDTNIIHAPITSTKPKIKNYIIYTGNLYPHKNLRIVLQAIKKLPRIKLKIICGRNSFAKQLPPNPQIEFLGYVDDQKFRQIYQSAIALVHPALIEGFSLTGLEAMALDCPVIASNTTCIPEIYGPAALYFDPNSSQELVDQIEKLQKSKTLRHQLIKLGHQQVSKYSWSQTSAATLKFYDQILNQR